jgi:very-short-patch-repair endonuclease
MRAASDAEVSRVLVLFRRRGGPLTWSELNALGVQRRTLDRLLRQHVIERTAFSVYELVAPRDTWERRVRRALATTSGWASHSTAAKLWGFDGVPDRPLHVTVPRARRRALPGGCGQVIVHTRDDIVASEFAEKERIRLTTPLRTALDLATLPISDETLCAFLGHLVANWFARPGRIESFAAGQPKRTMGAARLGRVAEQLGGGPFDSMLEARVLRLLVKAGLPRPKTQYEIRSNGRPIARADFAWPQHKVVLEADGFAFHSTPEAFEHDRARNNALELEGWRVYHVTPTRLRENPKGLTDEMRQALARAEGRQTSQQNKGRRSASPPSTRRSSALSAIRPVPLRIAV